MARHGVRRVTAAGSTPWTATPPSVEPCTSSRPSSFGTTCSRRRSWPRSGVVAAYFVLFLATEYAMLGIREWSWQFLFAVIATGSAMIVEGPKHRQLDDDLLMLVVPLAVLTAVVLIFRPPILV